MNPTADLRAELDSAGQMLFVQNHPQAEAHLRRYLRMGGTDPVALNLLDAVARGYGVTSAFRLSENHGRAPEAAPRYLLIKAWGYGFWSDVHHVMGQLLLAELTQRTPIVHWGSNSLFRDAAADAAAANPARLDSAFDLYFEPVSPLRLSELPVSVSIYPPKWSPANLAQDNVNKWEGAHSRQAAQHFFNRPEDVVVSDFYMTVSSLIPWIGTDSRYHGMSDDQIYTELFERYARPLPALLERVDSFRQAHMAGRHWVAVHVRGSDKIYESAGLHQTNLRYFGFVDRIIELNPDIGVFLLTDSVDVHAEFSVRYAGRLVTTPALRSASSTGVHMQGHSGKLVADEVLLDAYLARGCDYFIGNQESNVSLAIASLKRWPRGFLAMLGEKNGRAENLFLHKQAPVPVEKCRLCQSPVQRLFDMEVLGSHRVNYHRCMGCGALQTDVPQWLAEAYTHKAERFDTGKASRTLVNFLAFPQLLEALQVRKTDRAVDFGGGTGLFARLMRDMGYDFHCCDKYGSAEFMAGYAWDAIAHPCSLVTIFEVAEHFAEPAAEWDRLMACNPDFVIGSTGLYTEQAADMGAAWGYLAPESGQHVFFYSFESITYLARKHGRHAYNLGMYFVLSRDPLPAPVLARVQQWRDGLMPACQDTFQRWAQGPYVHATRDNQDVATWSQLEQRGARIAIDGVFFRFSSGIARVWRSLLAQWSATGFAEHLVVIDRGRTAPRLPGIRYVDLPHPHPAQPEEDRALLQQVCDREGVSLFISTYYSAPLTTPSALMVLDMIPEVIGYDLTDAQWVAKRRAIEYASAFISISHSTERDLVRFYPHVANLPKAVAHCGCDFRPASAGRVADFKARLGISRPYFLISGGRGDYKNAELFFKAFERLGEERSGLAIVCTNANRPLEAELAAHVGGAQVHMVALSDDDLQCAYSGAVALAYPSRYEGFGLPVAEAMACGCPVITCNNSSLPEVGGPAVIYVGPDDVDGMHAALLAVQQAATRADLIERGTQQATRFSWATMAREVARHLATWALTSVQQARLQANHPSPTAIRPGAPASMTAPSQHTPRIEHASH
jgi:glycosyltransferase involved in cell wall biosynthesis